MTGSGPTKGERGLRERSPGRWEISAYDPVGKRQVFTSWDSGRREWGAGVRTARAKRAELVAEITAGRRGGGSETLGQLLTTYIDLREQQGASPTTVRGYRTIARIVADGPGSIRLAKLGAHDLDRWYADRQTGGTTASTVHHYHRLISSALAQAERWGWVPRNVARLTQKIRVPTPELRVPPPERVVALIRQAQSSRAPDMAPVILVAALTGLRRGELCGLRWSDVDPDAGTITVRRSLWQTGKQWGVKDPKTHQVRTVGVGPRVLAALDLVRRRATDEATAAGVELVADAYVFSPEPDGADPKMPDVISQAFYRYCQALGREQPEPPWPYRFHDLRHYQATELVAAGLPIVTVSRRLGHARVSTTSDIYLHDVDVHALAAASALDDGFAALDAG